MACPASVVYHVGGGTLPKGNERKVFLNFRNNLILLGKNHASRYFILKMLFRFLLDGLAGIKFLVSGEFGHATAVIKANFSFYTTLGKTIKKRKELKKQIKSYTRKLVPKDIL